MFVFNFTSLIDNHGDALMIELINSKTNIFSNSVNCVLSISASQSSKIKTSNE